MLQTVHAKAKKWFLAFCAIITYSLAMDLFFVHNQIVSGGFAGLAMVICSLLPISIGAFLFILNIPCLILSFFSQRQGIYHQYIDPDTAFFRCR